MGEFTTGSGDTHNPANVTMGGEKLGTTADTGVAGDGVDASTGGVAEVDVPSGYETDVADLRSDDIVRQGKDEFPCFDVQDTEFYQNMQDGRRRLRFKSGTGAQKYMQQTKYNRPFFIRHTDKNGKKFVRKIK